MIRCSKRMMYFQKESFFFISGIIDDESIAISVAEEQTITYHTEWRNVYVDAYFSGAPVPPDPPPPSVAKKFPWLIAKAAQNWRM